MRVSATNVLAILGATASIASAQPVSNYGPNSGAVQAFAGPETSDVHVAKEKRQILTAIITAAGTAAATAAGKAAVEAGVALVKNIANWENAREEFTKKTVAEMWKNNPDPKKFAAAICYNKDYDLQDPKGMDGLTSAKLTSGPLHTDYDCFYMTAPNAVWTRGDGGFINLAVMSDKSRCTFDSSTSDLSCHA